VYRLYCLRWQTILLSLLVFTIASPSWAQESLPYQYFLEFTVAVKGKPYQDVDFCLSAPWQAQPALRVGVGFE